MLRARRSGDRILVRGRFSAPVQTGPETHPASYTMGTGSFLRIKRPERGVDHLPSSSADVKERVELYLYLDFRGLFESELYSYFDFTPVGKEVLMVCERHVIRAAST